MKSYKRVLLALLGSFLLSTSITHAAVYYVDGTKADNSGSGTSWATAKKDLQEAINLASVANDEVWVKAGTYLPTLNPNGNTTGSNRDFSFYIRNDIKLMAGFNGTEIMSAQRNPQINTTVLSGDLDGATGTNDCYHVLITFNCTNACFIDGLTITGGRGAAGAFAITSPSLSLSRFYGAGIYNASASSPSYNRCTVIGNVNTVSTGNGGGIYNIQNSSKYTDCRIISNSAGQAGSGSGGGMYCAGGTILVDRCLFQQNSAVGTGGGLYISSNCNIKVRNSALVSNTCGAGASSGGAICCNLATLEIENCLFANNATNTGTPSSNNGGGALSCRPSSTVSLKNSTFYNNVANGVGSAGGAVNITNSTIDIANCIFWNNRCPNNASNTTNRELYAAATTVFNSTISYCTVLGGVNPSNNFTTSSNITTSDPSFADITNPAGPDTTYMTADDGFRLGCSSSAKDAGDPLASVPATDILGNPYKGIRDLGAYEAVGDNTASNTLPTASTVVSSPVFNEIVHFTDCQNELLQLDATSPSTLNTSIIAKLFIQPTATFYNAQPYVRRSYEVTPVDDANTGTAKITFYYTQADFDDYNTARGTYPPLPTGSGDLTGIANIRITQHHGISSSGTPGSYYGWAGSGNAHVLLVPTSVVYNSSASRWEVTVQVTGFSGFFLHTGTAAPLPVTLKSFTAFAESSANSLHWSVAHPQAGDTYNVLRSSDGRSFTTLTHITATANQQSYSTLDNDPYPTTYYRLEISDASGKSYASKVVSVRRTHDNPISILPNPASSSLRITTTAQESLGLSAFITDLKGQTLHAFTITPSFDIDVHSWPDGIYILHLPDGDVRKLLIRH